MATWGLVATVKASEDKVLAFAAHHLSIGADHLALYFDDPDMPLPPALLHHPKVTLTLCDDAHWAKVGNKRPPEHQNRQSRNARHAYQSAKTDWLVHIDVDEFIHTPRPLTQILDHTAHDTIAMKFEPYEAMHDPLLPDDIYTSREFRGAIRHEHWRFRKPALGEFRKVIRDGMLSHTVGKVICRTGIPRLAPKIHTVRIGGDHVPTPHWNDELKLLHFHAQDRKAWLAALPFRLTRGAYQFRAELQAYLSKAGPEEIDAFYLRTQILPMDLARDLQEVGRVLIVDLNLRQKVAMLKGMTL
jgi:Glycosyl transferase family 2